MNERDRVGISRVARQLRPGEERAVMTGRSTGAEPLTSFECIRLADVHVGQ